MFNIFPATEELNATLTVYSSQVARVGVVAIDHDQLIASPDRVTASRGHGDGQRVGRRRFNFCRQARHLNRTVERAAARMTIVAGTIKRRPCASVGGIAGVGKPQKKTGQQGNGLQHPGLSKFFHTISVFGEKMGKSHVKATPVGDTKV